MIDNAEVLAGQLANVTLSTTWPVPQSWSDGVLLKQFQAVSKLIASSEARKVEREFFYVELGGFDTHNDFDVIDDLFAKIDESLDLFVKELKAQVWTGPCHMRSLSSSSSSSSSASSEGLLLEFEFPQLEGCFLDFVS